MFQLHVSPETLHAPMSWCESLDGHWESGASSIAPYRHPCLEAGMVSSPSDGRVLVVNRERVRGRSSWCSSAPDAGSASVKEFDRCRAEVLDWPLGFIIIDLAPGKVEITTSAWGVAPLHVTSADGTLRGSWDLLDLAPHVDTRRLDPVEVARFLTYADTYSTSTLLADVQTVTERATASYTGANVSISYPSPVPHASPRVLRPDADPVAAFERILGHVIDRWEFDPATAAVDVSGGMDSANVATTLAQLYPGRVTTGAMLLDGAMGDQQRRRRHELISPGFTADATVTMAHHLPFAPGGRRRRGEPFDPKEGAYAEARDELLDSYAQQGVRALFTGLGGDEVMKLRPLERRRLNLKGRPALTQRSGVPAFLGDFGRAMLDRRYDRLAPQGPALWSILDSYPAIYPQHMRHGIWPINPLAASEVVRLAESLPATWRAHKHLLRERLTQTGFSRDVTQPRLRENFQDILDTSMRRHGISVLENLLDRSSILVEDNYLDEAELRRAAKAFSATGERVYDVYRPLILESGLASLKEPHHAHA